MDVQILPFCNLLAICFKCYNFSLKTLHLIQFIFPQNLFFVPAWNKLEGKRHAVSIMFVFNHFCLTQLQLVFLSRLCDYFYKVNKMHPSSLSEGGEGGWIKSFAGNPIICARINIRLLPYTYPVIFEISFKFQIS